MNKAVSHTLPRGYPTLLADIKRRIGAAQMRAMLSVNAELVRLYWDIGEMIDGRQRSEGWGAAIIPRLARELHNELPEVKGFSERNIGRMISFYRFYRQPAAILPQPVAKFAIGGDMSVNSGDSGESLLWAIPWGHHALLMEKVADLPARLWYMQQTLAHGWSRNVLLHMVQSRAHERQGKAITNFAERLPPEQSDLARQVLKDPYIFDFLTLEEPFRERELETGLLRHVEKFLLELGRGFAFVGRQYHIEVGDEDFYVDLLFYHLQLRCFVVVDLKTGAFKAEHAGKMNFYCNVVDDRLRHPTDQPTVGLILCQDKNRLVAEYALRGVSKAIGVSEYQMTRSLPKQLRSGLPTIDELESELSGKDTPAVARARRKKRAKR